MFLPLFTPSLFCSSSRSFLPTTPSLLNCCQATMHQVVSQTMANVRRDRPVHLLGIGGIADIFHGVSATGSRYIACGVFIEALLVIRRDDEKRQAAQHKRNSSISAFTMTCWRLERVVVFSKRFLPLAAYNTRVGRRRTRSTRYHVSCPFLLLTDVLCVEEKYAVRMDQDTTVRGYG